MIDISVTKLTLINFVTILNNSKNLTLKKNYLKKNRFIIKEYEQEKINHIHCKEEPRIL